MGLVSVPDRLGSAAQIFDLSMSLDVLVGRIEPEVIPELPPHLPIISTLYSDYESANYFSITTDDAAIGREAADYFINRGFRHLHSTPDRAISQ